MDNIKLYSENGYFAGQMRRDAERRQRFTVIASALLHLTILAVLELPVFFGGEPSIEIQPRDLGIRFVPPPPLARLEPKPETPVAPAEVPGKIEEAEVAADESHAPIDQTKIDPTKAELTYEDPKKELQELLMLYRGQIGFGLPKDQGRYLNRVFNVTDQRETTSAKDLVSISEYGWPIKIEGSGYPLVDRLRKQYHLETYVAYALLSPVFADELYRALRRKSPAVGEVASAHVVISAGSAAGFEVTKVQMNANTH